MGVCGAIFDADARKRAATGTQLAGSVQWTALDNPHRGAVADVAQRPAAVVTVQQQSQRWLAVGVFAQMVDDLRRIVRLAEGREAEPSAVIFDSRTLQSTPESGSGAGFDGAKKRRGRKVPVAVDTLGHLLAVYVTAANEQDRAQVAELAEQVQAVTGGTVQVAFVDQGDTGE